VKPISQDLSSSVRTLERNGSDPRLAKKLKRLATAARGLEDATKQARTIMATVDNDPGALRLSPVLMEPWRSALKRLEGLLL
jgi:hypothetical protein